MQIFCHVSISRFEFAKYTIIFRRGEEEAVKTDGAPRVLKEGVTFFLME